jgi:hypothetical protein
VLIGNEQKGAKMNFIAAIQHAAIGYGIRRKAWRNDAILMLENNQLHWIKDRNGVETPNNGIWNECKLMGADITHDLTAEDIAAQDWEAI